MKITTMRETSSASRSLADKPILMCGAVEKNKKIKQKK